MNPKDAFPKPGKNERPQKFPGLESEMVTKPDFGKDTYKGSGKLSGKVALITGGDSGIGRAVALAYAREGADVAIAYLPQEEVDAQELKKIIEAEGRKIILLPGDLTQDSYTNGLIQKVLENLGKIDVLVNNAALQKYFKNIDDISAQDFETIYKINVVAPFVLSQSAAKVMKPGGSIINTVSVQAYDPDFLLLPYASSKGAQVALTKGLAGELIKKGIRVNAIAPGPIWSPLNTHGSPPEKLEKFGESSKIGRPGQPIELSPLYVLIASDEASYITGEIFGITGGEGIA